MKICPVFKAYVMSAALSLTVLVIAVFMLSSCSSAKLYQDPQYLQTQLAQFTMKLQSYEDAEAFKYVNKAEALELSQNDALKPEYAKLRSMSPSILASRGIKIDNDGRLIGVITALNPSANSVSGGSIAAELGISDDELPKKDATPAPTPVETPAPSLEQAP